jgi:ATP-dependent helicase YprA (DUF1998 family)
MVAAMARIKKNKLPREAEETQRGAAGLARSTAERGRVIQSKKLYRRKPLTEDVFDDMIKCEEDCQCEICEHEKVFKLNRKLTEDEISFLKEIGDYY